ncbi:hypothetical protein GCM10028895_27600 [Pontibacter rugosus]
MFKMSHTRRLIFLNVPDTKANLQIMNLCISPHLHYKSNLQRVYTHSSPTRTINESLLLHIIAFAAMPGSKMQGYNPSNLKEIAGVNYLIKALYT